VGVLGRGLIGETRALDVLGEGNNSAVDLPELWPIEYPIPKNVAHKITSPKNKANILPVPSVISVSSEP
jgi:hypothetical protein